MKKRNSKEIIQGISNPKIEHAYVKFPGKEIIDVSLENSDKSVDFDLNKIKKLAEEYGVQKYTELHTHPTGDSIPSGQDINAFLKTPNAKMMVVISQNQNSGQIEGYYFLRKRNKASPGYTKLKKRENEEKRRYDRILANNDEFYKNYELRVQKRNNSWTTKFLDKLGIDISLKPISEKDKEREREWEKAHFMNLPPEDPNAKIKEDVEEYARNMMAQRVDYGMQDLANKYNLQYRFVPEKGYSFNSHGGFRFKKNSLESTLATAVTIIFLSASLTFLSSNLTGNVIGNLNLLTSNFIGGTLFLIGLIGAFIYFKKKR